MPSHDQSKSLNIESIKKRLEKLGLSPSNLSEKIPVSKETVSKWLSGKKFPRPLHLLQLSEVLNLSFEELVLIKKSVNEPIIEFRKKGHHKIDEEYIQVAKSKAYILENLVSLLPFDNEFQLPILIEPVDKYGYIQKVVNKIRNQISELDNNILDFDHLIDFFNDRHSVIIPVLWGRKKDHANALHIFLPESNTTWVYLNLDSKIFDFKFWMAHELGHILAPQLKGKASEDFADNFAGALLFPEKLASQEYVKLINEESIGIRVNIIKDLARKYVVSPITVFLEIEKFTKFYNKPNVNIGDESSIYKANAVFQKNSWKLSELLFESKKPSPSEYLHNSKRNFNTPFFDTLGSYLKSHNESPKVIQSLLDMSYPDALSLHKELTHA